MKKCVLCGEWPGDDMELSAECLCQRCLVMLREEFSPPQARLITKLVQRIAAMEPKVENCPWAKS